MNANSVSWFVAYRMEWIAETIAIFGFINREHLMKKFGISMPQASADLNRFQKSNPGALRYDKTAKRYVFAACRKCGCTAFNACVDVFGDGCHWVEPDLCSACA
ncbi:MAG: hypothetical protein AB7P23_05575 [Amphiplicatus sp.]